MQTRLHRLFGGDLEMRVGVNTGEVVVGVPREGSSFVTGDAVNVADRLQKAAQPGEVLAGERTVAAAAGAFELAAPRHVEARGKPDGVVGHPRPQRCGLDASAGRERTSSASSSAVTASSICCAPPTAVRAQTPSRTS